MFFVLFFLLRLSNVRLSYVRLSNVRLSNVILLHLFLLQCGDPVEEATWPGPGCWEQPGSAGVLAE